MKIPGNTFSVFFILFISLNISTTIIAQSIKAKNYPQLNSLNEIDKNTSDTCFIKAFVNNIYNCPVCPPGMQCKPCIGNHIMVSDSLNSKKQFRVFVKEPGKFSIGEKYILLIHLLKYNSQKEVYEGKLIEME